METENKKQFHTKIKLMLLVVDNNHVPSNELISIYWFALKEFTYIEVNDAINELVKIRKEHITPAHIKYQIQGEPEKKRSDSEMRSAAHKELSKPEWERMGFESKEAYEQMNHKKWLKNQPH